MIKVENSLTFKENLLDSMYFSKSTWPQSPILPKDRDDKVLTNVVGQVV